MEGWNRTEEVSVFSTKFRLSITMSNHWKAPSDSEDQLRTWMQPISFLLSRIHKTLSYSTTVSWTPPDQFPFLNNVWRSPTFDPINCNTWWDKYTTSTLHFHLTFTDELSPSTKNWHSRGRSIPTDFLATAGTCRKPKNDCPQGGNHCPNQRVHQQRFRQDISGSNSVCLASCPPWRTNVSIVILYRSSNSLLVLLGW